MRVPETKLEIIRRQITIQEEDIAGRRLAIMRSLEQMGNEATMSLAKMQSDPTFVGYVESQLKSFDFALEQLTMTVAKTAGMREMLKFLESDEGEAR